jgi:tetratricopeptide (TPR) repeat protein
VADGEQGGGQVVVDRSSVSAVAAEPHTETSQPSAGSPKIATLIKHRVNAERLAMAVRLHLTHIPELDQLIALEYGRVDEGTPEAWWRLVGGRVGYFHDGAAGPAVGFKVFEVSELDAEAPELAAIWGAPRFDVPVLGLIGASAGEIILAARALFGARASIGHEFFALAVEASGEEALNLWLCSLEAGEAVAHYGVGATLYRLGRYHEAYRHLRYYTELAPGLTWTWCWYGRAAEALGLDGEARSAYRRAVVLEDGGGPVTGARELLADLEARTPRRPNARRWRRRRR